MKGQNLQGLEGHLCNSSTGCWSPERENSIHTGSSLMWGVRTRVGYGRASILGWGWQFRACESPNGMRGLTQVMTWPDIKYWNTNEMRSIFEWG